MICVPISLSSRGSSALTLACVPTGMNTGVSTTPWGVVSLPRRALVCKSVLRSSNIAGKFRKRNIHEQIGGDVLQLPFQRGEVAAFGQLQSRAGFEQGFAGHRRADDLAGKFLDVHARPRERAGDFADDARTVAADDFQLRLPAWRCRSLFGVGLNND